MTDNGNPSRERQRQRLQLLMSVSASFAMRVGGMAVALLVGIILARSLGVEGIGLYGLMMSICGLSMVPGHMGLHHLATRELARLDAKLTGQFLVWCWSSFAKVSTVTITGILIFGVLYGRFYDDVPFSLFVTVGLLTTLWCAANIAEACLRGLGEMTLGQLGQLLIRPGAFVIFLLFWISSYGELTVHTALLLSCLSVAVSLGLGAFWLKQNVSNTQRRINPEPQKSRYVIENPRAAWRRSAFPMAGIEFLRVGGNHLTILMLGLLSTLEEVGYFRVALSILPIVSMPIVVANVMLAPRISQMYAVGELHDLQRMLAQFAFISTVVVSILIALLYFVGTAALIAVFGSEFEGSYWPVLLLCIAVFIEAACGSSAVILNNTGRERHLFIVMGISLTATLVAIPLLIPDYGALGAAGAYAIGTASSMIFSLGVVWKVIGINPTAFGLIFRFSQSATDK